jgi:hypothetical protein
MNARDLGPLQTVRKIFLSVTVTQASPYSALQA